MDLCITERAWFSPLDDAVMTPVPLADVPAEVFSEAMRDLDLPTAARSSPRSARTRPASATGSPTES